MLSPNTRKWLLTVHIASAVSTIGAVAAFLALSLLGFFTADQQLARAAYRAMELVTLWVIVPLLLASLVIGIAQALLTRWGLFQHRWVIMKLALTAGSLVVLIVQLGRIRRAAHMAELGLPLSSEPHLQLPLIAHAAGGMLVLLAVTAISVFKPKGRSVGG
jgi:uncharacterized membrane protein